MVKIGDSLFTYMCVYVTVILFTSIFIISLCRLPDLLHCMSDSR